MCSVDYYWGTSEDIFYFIKMTFKNSITLCNINIYIYIYNQNYMDTPCSPRMWVSGMK